MNNDTEQGVLKPEYLNKILPPRERLMKGPVAIAECIQKIPCDPCAHICKFLALEKQSLIEPPKVDSDKCTGCGECVAICPGLAMFVVNYAYDDDHALLIIPYEFMPTPENGEIYEALNREGKPVGEAKIITSRKMKDRTTIVRIAVKKDLVLDVRNIGRKIR